MTDIQEETKAPEKKEVSANNFNERDIFWMKEAIKTANEGLLNGEVPVGAVFVDTDSDYMIAKSHNLTTVSKNATTHCEVNCIREITAAGKSSSLVNACCYVTVEPCIMCAYALNYALNLAGV